MEQLPISTFRPRLKVLNREQALAIHTAALDILGNIGFTMEHPGVCEMLEAAGCSVTNNGRMTMPEYLVNDALRSAPRKFTLYDQLGNPTMPLVDHTFYYGTGSDTIFTIDPETGERRRTRLEDTGNFARLIDALDHMHFSMSMGNPEDVPIDDIYVHVFAEMVKNSSKPICFIADGLRDMEIIHQMASAVAGSEQKLAEKPFILNYSEAISPLRFPENVMDKLMFCAEKQIPICLPSGCNAGSGGPVTLAGSMALGIAENLVGLVIHQLANKGAPFLFASNVSILDMKTTVVSYGCPEWSLTQAAFADMRDELYGLPIWAYAGASDAKVIDAQAGAEAMFSILTAMQSRCNFIHDVGYIEHGNTSSLEMLVMANELVEMSRHFIEGIPVNDDTLALDVIDRMVNGGNGALFLTDPHTFEHFRSAQFLPKLMDRSRYEAWEKEGSTDLYQRCNTEVKRILKEHEVGPKPDTVLEQLNRLLCVN